MMRYLMDRGRKVRGDATRIENARENESNRERTRERSATRARAAMWQPDEASRAHDNLRWSK